VDGDHDGDADQERVEGPVLEDGVHRAARQIPWTRDPARPSSVEVAFGDDDPPSGRDAATLEDTRA
jgi:hypothetical protein